MVSFKGIHVFIPAFPTYRTSKKRGFGSGCRNSMVADPLVEPTDSQIQSLEMLIMVRPLSNT